MTAEKKIKRIAEMYNGSSYEPSKECYVQLKETIIKHSKREDRESLRNLWSKLTEWEVK